MLGGPTGCTRGIGKPSRRAGKHLEAQQVGCKESRVVEKLSRRGVSGQEDLLEGQEGSPALPAGQQRSGGTPRGTKGVGRPLWRARRGQKNSRRAGRGQEAIPKGREGSADPHEGSGGLESPSSWEGSGEIGIPPRRARIISRSFRKAGRG